MFRRTKATVGGYSAGWSLTFECARMRCHAKKMTRFVTCLFSVAALNFAMSVSAQTITPFSDFAGQWVGSGAISLANNQQEPIKCRAAYDVLEEQHNLQLDIRCASESYKFELRGTATDKGGRISGSWTEATRNATGTLSGVADHNRLQVLAKGTAFTATLTLIIQGNKQTVSIKSQDAKTSIQGATINLRRS